MEQAVGIKTPKYTKAMKLAETAHELLQKEKLIFTGHSLGGGLACAACMVTGRTGYTFDAAGVSEETIRKELTETKTIAAYQLKNDAPKPVTTYDLEGEALHEVQTLPRIPQAEGKLELLTPAGKANPFRSHSMDKVLSALGIELGSQDNAGTVPR